MLGLLGFGVVGAIIVTSVVTTGVSLYATHHYAEKNKEENDKQMAKAERKAAVSNLTRVNNALNAVGEGVAWGEYKKIETDRKTAADVRQNERYDEGKPVSSA